MGKGRQTAGNTSGAFLGRLGRFISSDVTARPAGQPGPPDFLRRPVPVQIEFAGMFLMLVGFLVGWRWEAVGGVMAVAGFSLFLGTEMVVNGKSPGGSIPLFVVPGVLLLVSAGLRRA